MSTQESRSLSVGRAGQRQQSLSAPPEMQMVSVAVLPPRLPSGMASPTGLGVADAFGWDEAINWQHNDPIDDGKKKQMNFFQKAGLTTQRQKKDPNLPPFVMRQVPYDTWRKHYAKDKDGNYRGTHAPAENCLLKPEDVAKWRLGEAKTKADLWTRGAEALPVYDEVSASAAAPKYQADYTDPPLDEPTLGTQDGQGNNVQAAEGSKPAARIVVNGQTAQQVIDDAKAKPKPKESWKAKLKRGAETAMAGS